MHDAHSGGVGLYEHVELEAVILAFKKRLLVLILPVVVERKVLGAAGDTMRQRLRQYLYFCTSKASKSTGSSGSSGTRSPRSR